MAYIVDLPDTFPYDKFRNFPGLESTDIVEAFEMEYNYPNQVSCWICRIVYENGRYSNPDKPIIEFFEQHKAQIDRFLDAAEALVRQSIDAFLMDGRDYLQVAFGCYGGHHRSVYMAEHFAERLMGTPGIDIEVKHAARQYWCERNKTH